MAKHPSISRLDSLIADRSLLESETNPFPVKREELCASAQSSSKEKAILAIHSLPRGAFWLFHVNPPLVFSSFPRKSFPCLTRLRREPRPDESTQQDRNLTERGNWPIEFFFDTHA
jgi:hypothetical protein